MKNSRLARALGLAVLLEVFVSSCAALVHPMVEQPTAVKQPTATKQQVAMEQPTYLAQSPVADCRPGDSSMVCCIKKFPLTAKESCGATAVEVEEVLNGVKVLNEATQSTADQAAGTDGAKDATAEKDDPDAGWKQHCTDTYVACKDQKGWVGDCYACFRYCEGQRQWPFHLCTRKGKVR